MISLKKLPRAIRFTMVGSGAAAVHYLCVLLLVEYLFISALFANLIAFCVAFLVSFFGHTYLTFATVTRFRIKHTLPRFFLVASSAFGCNEILFFILIRYFFWPYQIALAFVLITVAAGTYICSQYWAFRARTN